MSDTEASKSDDKLHKLIKRAKKQHGMLWPSVKESGSPHCLLGEIATTIG